jgi:hypothetical protein
LSPVGSTATASGLEPTLILENLSVLRSITETESVLELDMYALPAATVTASGALPSSRYTLSTVLFVLRSITETSSSR